MANSLVVIPLDELRAMVFEASKAGARAALNQLPIDEEGFYPRAEVARMFGLNPETIRDWEKRNLLPVERVNRRAVYPKQAVHALVGKVNSGEVKIGKAPRIAGKSTTT